VQQHHRRAVAALEHGGRHPGQLEPPFADGDASQQLPPGPVDVGFPAALHGPLDPHADPLLPAVAVLTPVMVSDEAAAAKDRM
jgi:hypothetical protein